MVAAAEHARDGDADFAVRDVFDRHFAFAARAFELYHVARQRDGAGHAEDGISAVGAAVRREYVFHFKYHFVFSLSLIMYLS